MSFNAGQNLLSLKRFGDIINAPEGEGFQFIQNFILRADKDHRYVPGPFIRFQLFADFISGHTGHHDVKQNQIRRFHLCSGQGQRAVRHGPDHVFLLDQHL